MDSTTELIRLASKTQARFEAEDADECVVDEAIAWARL